MAPSFVATYEATPGSIAEVRNQMAALGRKCGLDDRAVDDLKIAVSEAATNAVVHGYRDGPGEIRVEATITASELLIAIRDQGGGMHPRPDSPGIGLGLPMIASLVNRFEIVDDGAPGTELRMSFDCPHGSALGAPA